MRKLLITLTIVFVTTIFIVPGSQAAYLYNWSATPSYDDPTDNHITDGQDIEAVWHAYSNGYHYFRLDLGSAPSISNFTGLYGIYIDSKTGGGSGTLFGQTYVPITLSGIDYIIDSHYEPNMGGWLQHDYHEWDGSLFTKLSDPDQHQQSENGGTTLEWRIDDDLVGTSFTWWGVSHDIGSSVTTSDVTMAQTFVVPIPGAIWFLGSGLLAIFGSRKGLKKR